LCLFSGYRPELCGEHNTDTTSCVPCGDNTYTAIAKCSYPMYNCALQPVCYEPGTRFLCQPIT